jgi:hypothetical protein
MTIQAPVSGQSRSFYVGCTAERLELRWEQRAFISTNASRAQPISVCGNDGRGMVWLIRLYTRLVS